MRKTWIALLLLLALTVTSASALGVDDPAVFLKQEGLGQCTLCSVTMLLRRKALLDLDEGWDSITQEAVRRVAWSSSGMAHNFTFHGLTVTCIPKYSGWGGGTAEGKREYLLQLLADHPEGVVAYSWNQPHAVLLTDYDPETDTVYCAEPSNYYPSGRIPLSESLIPGATQTAQMGNFHQLWYISGGTAKGAGTLPGLEDPQPTGDEDSPFQVVREYVDGCFSDVAEEDWFYSNVALSYQLGLFQGYDTEEFRPEEILTVAQAVTLAARLHSIYHTGDEDFPEAERVWYDGYVRYARDHHIILEDYSFDRPVNRDLFVHILASALPADQFPELREEVEAFADDYRIAYPQDVDLLYRAGILNGAPGEAGLYFLPDHTITRAEAAAILTRMARPSLRLR